MHARYFSAHLGRFHSVDPIGAAPSWPQSWNRYSYVLGNPIKYVDPQGLFASSFFFLFNGLPVTEIEGEPITVAAPFNPLTGLQGLGSLMSGRAFLNALSAPETRFKIFKTLHQRTDVQRFFSCLSVRSRATDLEAGGIIHVGDTGALEFSLRMGERERVLVGNLSNSRLIGVAHTHPPSGPVGFVAPGQGNANDFSMAINTKGFGGSRVPNYILHPRGGVTRFLSGADQLPGTQVLETGFDRGMSNVCQEIGSF